MPGLVPKLDQDSKGLTSLSSAESKYSRFLARMTDIGENDIIVRSNCKFCNHPARPQAEDKWERSGGSYASVIRFFEEYRKDHPDAPAMNAMNIRGHIDHHYKQQIRKLRMREYGDHLKAVMQERVDQMEMFEALTSSLQMKYVDVASDEEMGSSRQTDSMVKLAKILVDIAKFKAELSGDVQQINIFAERVLNVWTHAIQTEPDEDVKRKYLQVLNTLEAEVGGIGA